MDLTPNIIFLIPTGCQDWWFRSRYVDLRHSNIICILIFFVCFLVFRLWNLYIAAKFLDKDEANIVMTTSESTTKSNKLRHYALCCSWDSEMFIRCACWSVCSLEIHMTYRLSVNFVLNLISSERSGKNKGNN